jgi:hypothetical protein
MRKLLKLKMLLVPNVALRRLGLIFVWMLKIQFKLRILRKEAFEENEKFVDEDVEDATKHGIDTTGRSLCGC